MNATVISILTALTLLGTLGATEPDRKVQLIITGGHDTDPIDHGRPVVLIANALGVKPEVFRQAFSHVTPAPAGTSPKEKQVRQNKEALLGTLSPYGVTNDLLDRVSDYYRYRPGSGKLWPTRPAVVYATLSGGTVKEIIIADRGSGYSSVPKMSLPGYPHVKFETKLAFGRDLERNGSIASVTTSQETKP